MISAQLFLSICQNLDFTHSNLPCSRVVTLSFILRLFNASVMWPFSCCCDIRQTNKKRRTIIAESVRDTMQQKMHKLMHVR